MLDDLAHTTSSSIPASLRRDKWKWLKPQPVTEAVLQRFQFACRSKVNLNNINYHKIEAGLLKKKKKEIKSAAFCHSNSFLRNSFPKMVSIPFKGLLSFSTWES